MHLYVGFEIGGHLISVPDETFNNDRYCNGDFTRWMYDKTIDHKYWVTINGQEKMAVSFGIDAFIEWLNATILEKSDQKAVVIKDGITWEEYEANYKDVPSIYF